MLRNVRNIKEVEKVENYIKRDLLCLSNIILDAEKVTHDRVNNLDIDNVEEYLINNFEFILITELKKDRRNINLITYKINAVIQFKDDKYIINEWFTLNTKNDIFGDAEIMADNDYFIDEVKISC